MFCSCNNTVKKAEQNVRKSYPRHLMCLESDRLRLLPYYVLVNYALSITSSLTLPVCYLSMDYYRSIYADPPAVWLKCLDHVLVYANSTVSFRELPIKFLNQCDALLDREIASHKN